MQDLPRHHFRMRESGAAVFRVETARRDGRIEMRQIAVVDPVSGAVKPKAALTPEDDAAIAAWVAARAARGAPGPGWGAVDELGRAAQWAQAEADPEALEAVTDALLLAMHDLRGVLLRRRAERIEARRDEVGTPRADRTGDAK